MSHIVLKICKYAFMLLQMHQHAPLGTNEVIS